MLLISSVQALMQFFETDNCTWMTTKTGQYSYIHFLIKPAHLPSILSQSPSAVLLILSLPLLNILSTGCVLHLAFQKFCLKRSSASKYIRSRFAGNGAILCTIVTYSSCGLNRFIETVISLNLKTPGFIQHGST